MQTVYVIQYIFNVIYRKEIIMDTKMIMNDDEELEVTEYRGELEEEDADDVDTADSSVDVDSEEIVEMDDFSDVGSIRIENSNYTKSITRQEYNNLTNELAKKKAELEVAREDLKDARAAGDLSENEAYTHFKGVVAGLESDISAIEHEIKISVVVDTVNNSEIITKGSKVHLVITDNNGVLPTEEMDITIVSEGHGGIDENSGEIKVPENSEVYRNMVDMKSGSFDLTGTDGNSYHYVFNIVRGD